MMAFFLFWFSPLFIAPTVSLQPFSTFFRELYLFSGITFFFSIVFALQDNFQFPFFLLYLPVDFLARVYRRVSSEMYFFSFPPSSSHPTYGNEAVSLTPSDNGRLFCPPAPRSFPNTFRGFSFSLCYYEIVWFL